MKHFRLPVLFILGFFAFLYLLPQNIFSQEISDNSILVDQVELQDGSTLVGEIVHLQAGAELILKLRSGSTVILNYSDIKQIRQIKDWKIYNFRERGVYVALHAGLLFGDRSGEPFNFYNYYWSNGFQIIVRGGYQLNRLLGVGLETGYSNLFGDQDSDFLPLAVNLQGFIFGNRVTPFYSLSAGYGFSLGVEDDPYSDIQDRRGGLYFHPSLGVRLSGKKQANLYFTLGLLTQKAEYDFNSQGFPPQEVTTKNYNFDRWELSFGVMF